MANPTTNSWEMAKRVVRHLKGELDRMRRNIAIFESELETQESKKCKVVAELAAFLDPGEPVVVACKTTAPKRKRV